MISFVSKYVSPDRQKSLKDYGDKVSAEDKTNIEKELSSLKETIKTKDAHKINAAMESLHNLNRRLDDQKRVAEEQAATDVLTGLWNRRAFDERLARLSAGVRPFALMHLDLDRFKRVNDTLGHAAGDHVLKHVGQIMSEEIRGRDSVARIGGDEFMIILEGVTDGRELSAVARRLIDRISRPMPYKDRDFVVSASLGIVIANLEEALSPESLFGRADLALYAAKSAGRADHRFYDSALERQFERRLDGTEPARRA
mgnify:CR=1 FL=1